MPKINKRQILLNLINYDFTKLHSKTLKGYVIGHSLPGKRISIRIFSSAIDSGNRFSLRT